MSIDKLRVSRVNKISLVKNKINLENPPPTHCSGLYWIYTSYSISDLQSCQVANSRGAVNIKELASDFFDLEHICQIKEDVYWLVYNGIGGVGPQKSGGLRDRIRQQFNGGEGTGSLTIRKTSLNDLSKWRYSYVILPSIYDKKELDYDLDMAFQECEYTKNSERLETGWRLQFGWPLLCKK